MVGKLKTGLLVVGAAFGSLALTGAAFAADGTYGWLLPESISAEGDRIDNLFWFIFAVTGITFLLTEGALLYFIFKYRTRPGMPKPLHTHGSHKLEMIWTIIPAIILAILAITQTGVWLDLKTVKASDEAEADGAFVVHVIAQQFAWKFRYAGPDGKFGTADDFQNGNLHAPKGRKVVLRMRSLDVIHSLFMPHLRFKQDVVPGIETHGWFEARKAGQFPVVCAELCGPQHYTMKAYMIIHEAADFETKMSELAQVGPIDVQSDSESWRFWPVSQSAPVQHPVQQAR